jgi:hypothetical protein
VALAITKVASVWEPLGNKSRVTGTVVGTGIVIGIVGVIRKIIRNP